MHKTHWQGEAITLMHTIESYQNSLITTSTVPHGTTAGRSVMRLFLLLITINKHNVFGISASET